VSNTQPIAPQIEAQRPLQGSRGGITTVLFMLVVAVIAVVVYTTSMQKHDAATPHAPAPIEEGVTDDINWEAGQP
jgi:hypothetical protein